MTFPSPQNTGQDEGDPGEAGAGEGVRRDPGRQPHLQLRRGAHLRGHRLPGLFHGRQPELFPQPPLPSSPEPPDHPDPPDPPGQWPTPGSPLRPGQQAP